MTTTVVNVKVESCTYYCGRDKHNEMHFGNPFSHIPNIPNTILVNTREDACDRHNTWVRGLSDFDVEPERRIWIIQNLEVLRNNKLGCFCKPKRCHCDNYVILLAEAIAA